jgi:hypothetical protein
MKRAEKKRAIDINKQCQDGLKFLLFVLTIYQKGIRLNLIAYRMPTHTYRSDFCPAGLGGYNNPGFVWRFCLPGNLKFRASNNLLKHIMAFISPSIVILTGQLKDGDCSLSIGDSTTLEG